jgi:hypothetical protein
VSEIVDLDSFRERVSKLKPPHPITDALNALASALVDHGHVWTDRERSLYEVATAYIGGKSG